ncbi:DEAD/DEAH box helicase family protein [Nocardia takedensis]
MTVLHRIAEQLLARPKCSATQLADALADPAITRSEINRVLYKRQDIFQQFGGTPPVWAVRADHESMVRSWFDAAGTSPGASAYAGPALRTWQTDALAAWRGAGHRAVIEAVSGTGKTALGVAAVAGGLDHGHRVLVVVPDNDHLTEWVTALRDALPGRVIGDLDRPTGSRPPDSDVSVVTAHSAGRLRPDVDVAPASALIVDEVQDYAAGVYAKVLLDGFEWRLGLATVAERPDDLVETVVSPYFGATIRGCDHRRAVEEAILPRLRVVRVNLDLDEQERRRLERLEESIARARETLIGTYGAPEANGAEFDSYTRLLVTGRGTSARIAKRYLDSTADRDALLAECEQKVQLVRHLPAGALARTHTVLFTERASSAGQVVRALEESGLPAARGGTGLSASERGALERRVRAGELRAVAESGIPGRVLPGTDPGLGVFLSTSWTERRTAHRLGRIMRSREGAAPVLVVGQVRATADEPQRAGAVQAEYLRHVTAELVTTDVAGMAMILEKWLAEPTDRTEPETAAPRGDSDTAPDPQLESPANPPPVVTPGPPAEVVTASPTARAEVVEELRAALVGQGGIGTVEELGDLVGLTEPEETADVVEAAAAGALLHFCSFGDDSDDLILLSVATGGTPHERDRASSLVVTWIHSPDPLAGLHALMSDMRPVRVPAYRLVQIAAFVRGVASSALI